MAESQSIARRYGSSGSLYGDALDGLLARSLAALVEEGAINLELISAEVLKAQALTGASAERRRRRLKARAVAAAERLQELRAVLDRDDPIADEWHDRAARGRIAQWQGARVNAALAQTTKLVATRPKNVRQDRA